MYIKKKFQNTQCFWINPTNFKFWKLSPIMQGGREGILDNKLHWYPELYTVGDVLYNYINRPWSYPLKSLQRFDLNVKIRYFKYNFRFCEQLLPFVLFFLLLLKIYVRVPWLSQIHSEYSQVKSKLLQNIYKLW